MANATRKLTDIRFEHEGAHVALVGKHQGGPANGVTTLVYKSLDNITDELVQKAGEVTVTLSFEEFLRKFFGMYWEDSKILAMALGYGSDEDDDESEEDEPKSYKDYLDEKVSAISIMKNVYKAVDMRKALSELPPEDTLALMQAQELLEKAMSSALPEGDLTIPSAKQEDTMSTIEKALHEELVTKAVQEAEEVLKAQLNSQAEILKALQEEVETFKAAKAEAQAQARKAALAAVVAGERVEALFKSTAVLADEDFEEVVATLKAARVAEEQSALFKEAGVAGAGEPDPAVQDQTAAILKAKYANK